MIVSRLALDSVWNRPETRTPPLVRDDINTSSDISRSFLYSSRRSDNSGTKPCFIADSHGEAKPSAFIKIYYFNCCSRLLPWGQSRTFTRIDTIHYSALVSFVVQSGFRLAKRLWVARAFKRNSPVIFFIQSTNACTLIYLGTQHQLDID